MVVLAEQLARGLVFGLDAGGESLPATVEGIEPTGDYVVLTASAPPIPASRPGAGTPTPMICPSIRSATPYETWTG